MALEQQNLEREGEADPSSGDSLPKPTFSPFRKWTIGLNVGLVVLVVLSIVVMVNYLSQDYFTRFHLSALTRHELSPLTVKLLKSMTNQVKVTIYYDKDEPLYETLAGLLKEYSMVTPRISVETIDYLRNPGGAQKLKAAYKLGQASDKNLIIFDCEGRLKVVDGNALAQYVLEQVPSDKEREFRRKPTIFEGEKKFTSALLDVLNPKELTAYFLQGHEEHLLASTDEREGYSKFAEVLQQYFKHTRSLHLLGTNTIPADCSLLVIAGPRQPFQDSELEKLDQYLSQGGRLLLLLTSAEKERTGLEKVLARWGVKTVSAAIIDPDQNVSQSDVIVSGFSKHSIVNPLVGFGLYLARPRPVGKLPLHTQAADAPRVDEIAFTGDHAFFENDPARKQRLPLIVAVEKGSIKGVERGNTRIIIAGDSTFLANHQIDLLANRDFAGCAVSWLVDSAQMVEGVAARPVIEFRLVMTPAQLQAAEWVLVGAMPGVVLAVGGLVWLRRRK